MNRIPFTNKRFSVFMIAIVSVVSPPLADARAANSFVNTYRYDALGRLVKTCAATAGAAQATGYSLDPADNRQNTTSSTTTVIVPVNGTIYSQDGRFVATLQNDGNFVLYGPTGALWSTSTVNSGATDMAFQSDGNLVLYTSSGVVWASNTAPNYCATLILQNDGNLVITNADGIPFWSTNTGGH